VYRREVAGRTLTFGVSGMLLKNGLLMFDRETGTLWSHLRGDAVAGPLRGRRLEVLAGIPRVTWSALRRRAPGARVLSVGGREDVPDGYAAYHADPRRLGVRPPARRDRRLPGKAIVLGVRVRGAAKAYPLDRLGEEGAVNDVLGGLPIVAAWSRSAGASAVYDRRAAGRMLRFHQRLVGGRLRDRATGTAWDLLRGTGLEGPLAEERLRPVPHVTAYWFAWVEHHPDTRLHAGP